MRRRVVASLGLSLATLLIIGLVGMAQIPLAEFEGPLHEIPVANPDRYLRAIDIGLGQPDFPAEELLRLLERLVTHAAPSPEKEAVLLPIVAALEEGLPIEGLVNKAFEGLARRIPLPDVEHGLHQRFVLLGEVRDLLYSKGIFSVAPGAPQSSPSAIPTPRFNQLLINIADAIGDHLEGGGSPFDGHVLFQMVRERLIMLEGVTLPPEDVELVLERLEPSDLTDAALAAVS